MALQSQVVETLATEETLGMTLALQGEIIDETLETVISIDLSAKHLLTMIGNVKSVITLIFHLELNVIDAGNLSQVEEEITETVGHAEMTVQDEIIEGTAENADNAENVDHAETTAHLEMEAHAENVGQEEMTARVEIIAETTGVADNAESVIQPFVNSVAPEANHQAMRTTEAPSPLTLAH